MTVEQGRKLYRDRKAARRGEQTTRPPTHTGTGSVDLTDYSGPDAKAAQQSHALAQATELARARATRRLPDGWGQ
jgi:hypothetical protein